MAIRIDGFFDEKKWFFFVNYLKKFVKKKKL